MHINTYLFKHRLSAFFAGFIFLIPGLFSLAGCNLYEQDRYQQDFVVESYLIAQEPLPEIRLSTTAPFDEGYHFKERAVADANVRLYHYDETEKVPSVYQYLENGQGIYVPSDQDTSNRIMPRHRYRLEVDIPLENGDNHRLEAETIIPDTFSVQKIIRDQAVYQSAEQLEFRITRNRTDGRQLYYIYSTKSLEPSEENITPFWNDAVDEMKEAIQIRTTIVNEENFDLNPDETLTLRMPWIGIAFYGKNTISTFSLDDNTYDYFRSQPVQTGGGGTLSPGEIQNIIYHIDGGIGLFGGMSVLKTDVNVIRPPER